jgi:hypothetical protein
MTLAIERRRRMRTCLAHPTVKAVHWSGHVHVHSCSLKAIDAGWCQDCQDFEQVQMYVKNWKRCQECCGQITKFR